MQLGIDAGATRTKWSAARQGGIVARGDAPPLTGHVFTDEQARHARDCLQAVREGVNAACPGDSVQRVVAGVTGLAEGEAPAHTMARLIAETFQCPPDAVTVASDLRLTYLAYHQPGEGILLYAGTGSIAYHLSADGHVVRAGGYGFMLGDEGGAYWMGREALARLLRERDEGREPRSHLARALAGRLGDLDWPTIRAYTYGQQRGHVASLAPLVTAAAAQGDEDAHEIVREGARELARLARCAARQAPGAKDVTACGGAISDQTYHLLASELEGSSLRLQRGLARASDANALLNT